MRVAIWLQVKVHERCIRLRHRLYPCFLCDTYRRCSNSMRLVALCKCYNFTFVSILSSTISQISQQTGNRRASFRMLIKVINDFRKTAVGHIITYAYECTAGSDILRELYSELATELDARIVAANMYQRNALTLKELQSIQSQRDRPIEAAETLMNIILDQPDAVYLCFLDVLKHTEQQHIYKRVVEGGYKGLQIICFSSLFGVV